MHCRTYIDVCQCSLDRGPPWVSPSGPVIGLHNERVGSRKLRVRVLAQATGALLLVSCVLPGGDATTPAWRAPPAVLVSEVRGAGSLTNCITSDVGRDGRRILFTCSTEHLDSGRLEVGLWLRDTRRKTSTPIEQGESDFSEPQLSRPPFGVWDGADLSANGRYVAFESTKRFGDDDRKGTSDIFVFDRRTKRTRLVSRSTTGRIGNRGSHEPSISADGRFVAFSSYATNFGPDQDRRRADVFLRDRRAETTTIVSAHEGGRRAARGARADSGAPAVADDGTRVAYLSENPALVVADTNRAVDAFVHDIGPGLTTRVSVSTNGDQLEPFVYSESATTYRDGVDDVDISGNGRVVVFESHANGLVEEDDNNNVDIFAHEIESGTTQRVSVATGGGDAYRPEDRECGTNGQCFTFIQSHSPSVTRNGRFVAFLSGAPRLHSDDRDPRHGVDDDVFVHDRATVTTQLVNRLSDGSPGRENNLYAGEISANGLWMTYASDSNRLAKGAADDSATDVFLQRLPHPL
jgi:WD40-like Beta Propeller Repeat